MGGGLASSQSADSGKPSASRSRFTASAPLQSSSIPFSAMSTAPGWIAAFSSWQSLGLVAPSPSTSGTSSELTSKPSQSTSRSTVSASPASDCGPQSTRSGKPSRANSVSALGRRATCPRRRVPRGGHRRRRRRLVREGTADDNVVAAARRRRPRCRSGRCRALPAAPSLRMSSSVIVCAPASE